MTILGRTITFLAQLKCVMASLKFVTAVGMKFSAQLMFRQQKPLKKLLRQMLVFKMLGMLLANSCLRAFVTKACVSHQMTGIYMHLVQLEN